MAQFPVSSCQRVTRKHLLVSLVTCVVIYNEWMSYALTTLTWPPLHTTDGTSHSPDDAVTLLLAADPQILTLISDSEPVFPLSLITVWDGNRYVSRGFQMALWKIKPDVVIFLGDLLNDGSIINDTDFNSTLQHFRNIMAVPNYVKHVIFVPGDNDIGGEGTDLVTEHKVSRFYSFLNQSMTLQYKFVDFIQMRAMDDFAIPDYTFVPAVEGRIRVLLSHMPLLVRTKKHTKLQIKRQQPSFIFSGHEHDSFHFTSTKQESHAHGFEVMEREQRVWNYDSLGNILHEVTVPTCSYRMGKLISGYGAAVIDKSGRITYTVLWLPSRFTQLGIYLGTLCLIAAILLFPGILHLLKCCIYKPVQVCVLKSMAHIIEFGKKYRWSLRKG